MNAITMILTTIIVLIVLALALFGLLAAASWIASYRYEIPADSIDAIEEAVEDMRDHYRTVDNPDKQTTALNEIWEQVQIIKDLENEKSDNQAADLNVRTFSKERPSQRLEDMSYNELIDLYKRVRAEFERRNNEIEI